MNSSAKVSSVIVSRIPARAASDGDGVKIKRVIPIAGFGQTDPFLMLDEIRSDDASDYSGGFPSHPHRGFETVTYMRQGVLEHQDHMGNRGVIASGGAQWMTAGRGVIHSEMPLQKDGAFHGFQLWLNLPASEKLRPAEYHNLEPDMIPVAQSGEHRIAVLGGRFRIGNDVITGPVGHPDGNGRATDPHIWDIELNGTQPLTFQLDGHLHANLFLYDGNASVNGEALFEDALTQLKPGAALTLNTDGHAKLLLLAGKPLKEAVAQYGPFVMNNRDQIEQAIRDYQAGTLTD